MKTKMIDLPRTGEATLITQQQGLYGKVRHWKIDDGSFVITSSAHHYPTYVHFLAREMIGDMPHADGLVSETAVFTSNEAGEIPDWIGICKVYEPESHEVAMRLAGFTLRDSTEELDTEDYMA